MPHDSVLDNPTIRSTRPASHSIAVYSQGRSEPKPEVPVDRCRRACQAYEAAHAEFLESFGSVTGAKNNRNAAGTAALAALAVLAMANASLAWGIALIVTLGCSAFAFREQMLLNEARSRCQTSIQAMFLEHRTAKKECPDADGVPLPPVRTCP